MVTKREINNSDSKINGWVGKKFDNFYPIWLWLGNDCATFNENL